MSTTKTDEMNVYPEASISILTKESMDRLETVGNYRYSGQKLI